VALRQRAADQASHLLYRRRLRVLRVLHSFEFSDLL
jgi:hypothetical protein